MIKQIVIRLSEEDHMKLKLKTVKEQVSIQELVETFIKQYVSGDESINDKQN